nr:hypothetical protein [Microscillaceae bacterium]
MIKIVIFLGFIFYNALSLSIFAQNSEKGVVVNTTLGIGRVMSDNTDFRTFAAQNNYQEMRNDNFTNLGFQFGATYYN